MFYGLKDQWRRTRFATRCKGILQSAPVTLDPRCELALVSQLQHKDVLMFLLAVKSFTTQVRPRAIFVLNDGSLSADDRTTLRKHVPGISLLELPSFRSDACPTGGTWERLLAIATLVDEYYVIQLDSDTLTLGPIDEVRSCVESQTAYALGTWDRQKIDPMFEQRETAQRLSPGPNDHVQLVAEANFDKLADFATLRYVRGCSGFAGFARRSFSRQFVESISAQMQSAIGEKWKEWGSEQVMSNIVLANIAKSVVLPHPKYADCWKMKPDETAFVHFIGSCRFNNGTYAALGARVIDGLSALPATLPRTVDSGIA